MLWQPPGPEFFAAWGGARKLEDYPEPHQTVWHENWDIVSWFSSMMTQFVHNGYGYTRLDYTVAYREFDDMGIEGDQRDIWKRKLRVLESAALADMNETQGA